ncbi:MAG: NAD(P)/FAD-dependent oxidoreductase, partial [Acidimicrobiales bacterium]
MLDQSSSIAVVGASLAGLRAAETLRSEGFGGRLVMIGEEAHLPYERPPLSKQFLAGKWGFDRVRLRAPEKIEALEMDLRLGRRAMALDVEGHRVSLDDGSEVTYDGLVIATGAHPCVLAGTADIPGVRTLRTLEDSAALAEATSSPGTRIVVVGAGFIGSEVAATCHEKGAEVTLVEALAVPLDRVLGPDMGAACAALHRAHGVSLRTG